MKRYTIVKKFSESFKESDVVIITGEELCKEFYEYDRPGNFYLDKSFGLAISFATGLSMCTDKRVFVFTGEGDLIREFASVPHAAVSKCKNLFITVLNNGIYENCGAMPNIFNEFSSPHVAFFQFGFTTYNLTDYVKNSKKDQFKNFLDRNIGPMALLIKVSKGLKKNLKNLKIDYEKHAHDLLMFVTSFGLDTGLYEPPDFIKPKDEDIKSINLNEISGGI